MEKITKVQEVSSFIMHFDSKFWNEIVLRLTIIGIRYITNRCHNFFKWKMEDLSNICEQLKPSKSFSTNNFKTFIDKNPINNKYNIIRNENNIYNYNYSNKTFFKKISKDKPNKKNLNNCLNNKGNYKSKSFLNKSSVNQQNNNNNNKKYYINNGELNLNNNYISNNSMLLLSDRVTQFDSFMNKNKNSFGKIKDIKIKENNNINNQNGQKENNKNIKYYEEKNEQNTYFKNKKYSNRNKILSLNKEYSSNSFMDINVIVSDFPFNMNKKKNNNNIPIRKKLNQIENIGQISMFDSHRDYLKIDNNINNIDLINHFNNSSIIKKEYNLKHNENKNNNYLSNELEISNNLRDFISELRKMSNSKEKNINENNNKKRLSGSFLQSKTFNLIPPLIIRDNDSDIKLNYTSNLNKEENIIKNNNIRNEISNNYDKINNHQNIQSKTVIRNYENFDINCDCEHDHYTNNSIDNIQNNKQNYNKYLKNPNYKSKKIRSNSIDDLNNKRINFSSYISSSDKENKDNININYKNIILPKTDRDYCHYFYESKPCSNFDKIINEKNIINNFKETKSEHYKNDIIDNNEI